MPLDVSKSCLDGNRGVLTMLLIFSNQYKLLILLFGLSLLFYISGCEEKEVLSEPRQLSVHFQEEFSIGDDIDTSEECLFYTRMP